MKNYKTKKGVLVDAERLNDYEKQNARLSYKTAWERFANAPLVLCNNAPNVDSYIFDNIVVGSLYDNDDNEKDIYQYYLTNINDSTLDWLDRQDAPFIIAHSDVLNCEVLMVDHFGTAWDHVLTNIEIY